MKDKVVWIGPLIVMKSAAGYYVGRECRTLVHLSQDTPPDLITEPHERVSKYYSNALEAGLFRDFLLTLDNAGQDEAVIQ